MGRGVSERITLAWRLKELNTHSVATKAHTREFFKIPPRTCPNARFNQTVILGKTTKSGREIQAILDELSTKFVGNSYHLLNRNCNHFSNEFSNRILGKGIPSWVNRLAWAGSWFQCFLPKDLPMGPSGSDVAGGSSNASSEMSPRARPVFQGQGNRLSDSPSSESIGSTSNNSSSRHRETSLSPTNSTSSPSGTAENEVERRERLVRAALKRQEQSKDV